jgi:hypothetical protein
MPRNIGAKGTACSTYLRSVASSSCLPWLRDGRKGAGAAAAGELAKKQAAAAFKLGKK